MIVLLMYCLFAQLIGVGFCNEREYELLKYVLVVFLFPVLLPMVLGSWMSDKCGF